MKIIFSLFIIIFQAVTISAIVEGKSRETQLYLDPEGRFKFQFTGDWRIIETKNKPNVAGHFVVAKDGVAAAEVIIIFEKLKKPVSLKEYIASEQKRFEKTEGFEIIKQNNITIGGYPAVQQLINLLQKDEAGNAVEKKIRQYYFEIKQTVWGITVITLPKYEDVISDIHKTMIKSFTFIPQKKIIVHTTKKQTEAARPVDTTKVVKKEQETSPTKPKKETSPPLEEQKEQESKPEETEKNKAKEEKREKSSEPTVTEEKKPVLDRKTPIWSPKSKGSDST